MPEDMSICPVLDAMKAWFDFTKQNRVKFNKILKDMDWNGYLLTEVWFERLAKAVNPRTEPKFVAIRKTYADLQSLVIPLKPIFMPNALHVVFSKSDVEKIASNVKTACKGLWKALFSLLSMPLGEILMENITMIQDISSRVKDWCENQLIPLILEAKDILDRVERALYGGTYDIGTEVEEDVEDEHGAREEGEEEEGNETEAGSETEGWSEIEGWSETGEGIEAQEEDGLEEELPT